MAQQTVNQYKELKKSKLLIPDERAEIIESEGVGNKGKRVGEAFL